MLRCSPELHPEMVAIEATRALSALVIDHTRLIQGATPLFCMVPGDETSCNAGQLMAPPGPGESGTGDFGVGMLLDLRDYQGKCENPQTGEQPGKIPLEIRREDDAPEWMQPQDVTETRNLRRSIGKTLEPNEGDNDGQYVSYHSLRATPEYARTVGNMLLGEYTAPNFAKDFPVSTLGRYRNQLEKLEASFDEAIEWILHSMRNSDIGLVESAHTNPDAPWLSSRMNSASYLLHADGQPMNTDGPHTPGDVQGIAFDAFDVALKVVHYRKQTPSYADELVPARSQIQKNTLARFVMTGEDGMYLASALDRDKDGAPRQQRLATAYGSLLESDMLMDPRYDQLVVQIVKRLFKDIRLGGIPSMLDNKNHLGNLDPHGNTAVRIDLNLALVEGLYRYGFPHLALELETRIYCLLLVLGYIPDVANFTHENNLLVPVQTSADVQLLFEPDPNIPRTLRVNADGLPTPISGSSVVRVLTTTNNHHAWRRRSRSRGNDEQSILEKMTCYADRPTALIKELSRTALPAKFIVPAQDRLTPYMRRKLPSEFQGA
jgi:hypothetical protein